MSILTVERKVLQKNDDIAAQNRAMFKMRGVAVINLVSSPGSGKTSIIERTLEALRGKISVAVIEGDVQTSLDAQRVERFGVPVVQIVTNGGCHLEAQLIRDALGKLDLTGIQLLIIENVGNLVCPANYDLGEDLKVVIVSTTEGDDKPLKYPAMFRKAAALIVNKIDLTPYLKSSIDKIEGNAFAINPALRMFETSCMTEEGIHDWVEWLVELTRVARPLETSLGYP
jgi:hydrogenase nickel incorporation protein HypB